MSNSSANLPMTLAKAIDSSDTDTKLPDWSIKKNKYNFSIGDSDFKKVRLNQARIVDKSLFIKAVIDDDKLPIKVILRPRRYGKSLNLSMLRYYYAKPIYHNEHVNLSLFNSLKIWEVAENNSRYKQEQARYYVIFLSFKDMRSNQYEDNYRKIKNLIREQYQYFSPILLNACLLDADEKIYYQKILDDSDDPIDCAEALFKLTQFLYEKFGKQGVILLIDEYDTPITAAHEKGFGEKMREFMFDLLEPVFKNNKCLKQAVVMGVSHEIKNDIAALNNVRVYNLLNDAHYAEYFGFTDLEIHMLIKNYAPLQSQVAKIEEWYGKIRVHDKIVFNPWSIVSFLADNANRTENNVRYSQYWIETVNQVKLIEKLKAKNSRAAEKFHNALKEIEEKGHTTQLITTTCDLDKIGTDELALFSYLLMTGYLTFLSFTPTNIVDRYVCNLTVPNAEIKLFFKNKFNANDTPSRNISSLAKPSSLLSTTRIPSASFNFSLERKDNRSQQQSPLEIKKSTISIKKTST